MILSWTFCSLWQLWETCTTLHASPSYISVCNEWLVPQFFPVTAHTHWPISGLAYSLSGQRSHNLHCTISCYKLFLHQVGNHILISLFYSTLHFVWNTVLPKRLVGLLSGALVTWFLVAKGNFFLKCLHSFLLELGRWADLQLDSPG